MNAERIAQILLDAESGIDAENMIGEYLGFGVFLKKTGQGNNFITYGKQVSRPNVGTLTFTVYDYHRHARDREKTSFQLYYEFAPQWGPGFKNVIAGYPDNDPKSRAQMIGWTKALLDESVGLLDKIEQETPKGSSGIASYSHRTAEHNKQVVSVFFNLAMKYKNLIIGLQSA